MISRDSKSYPYLAIAQHCNIPYAEVLKFADEVKEYKLSTKINSNAYTGYWKTQVLYLVMCGQNTISNR